MTLQNFPLISNLIAKTLQLTINHHSCELLLDLIKECELTSCYNEEEICAWFVVDCKNMNNEQVMGKYIFETNKFTILLVIENNHTIEIGYMLSKLPWIYTIMDEKLNIEDSLHDLDDLSLLKRTKQITIEKLSNENLQQTLLLRDGIFQNILKKEQDTLKASLDPKEFTKYLKSLNIKTIEYFIAKDEEKVVGLGGIYTQNNEPDNICWLGWFGVDEHYRGTKIGQKILDYCIDYAKKELSKKVLHLYSYDSKEYHNALNLYKKYRFEQYMPDFKINKKDLYFKLNLQ